MEHFGHDHSCAVNKNELHIDSHNNDCLYLHFFKKLPTIELDVDFEPVDNVDLSVRIWFSDDRLFSEQLINLTSRAPPHNML